MSGKTIAAGTVLEEEIIPGLSAAEIAHYSTVSGDSNPVHTDHMLAKEMGLDSVPVQGMFVMALVNNYLESWQHYNMTRKLHIRFVAPALADRNIQIAARVMVVSEQTQTAILRILLHQADKLVALGEADVVFAST